MIQNLEQYPIVRDIDWTVEKLIDFENKFTGMLWKLVCTDETPELTVSYIIENFAIDLPVG